MQILDDAYASAAYIPTADRFIPLWEKAAEMFREQLKKRAAQIAISSTARQIGKNLTSFHRSKAPRIF